MADATTLQERLYALLPTIHRIRDADRGQILRALLGVLEEAFSFDERAFAQSVTAAEIVSLLQAVDGVLAVDLNGLWLSTDTDPTTETAAENALSAILLASAAVWNATTKKVDPAELLLIDTSDDGIKLEEMN